MTMNARRGGNARPVNRGDDAALKPLQVYLPDAVHREVKAASATHGLAMSAVVGGLLSIFTHDPALLASLLRAASARDRTLGELVHQELQRADPS